LPDGSGFIVVSTSDQSSFGQPTFPILYSQDLVNWTPRGYVFNETNWPLWGLNDAWAPEIHFVDGVYIVYFSMRHRATGTHAIGAAKATNPYGPYTDCCDGQPIYQHRSGAIDAHWFKDPRGGKTYLAWKQNSIPSAIILQEIQADGLHFSEGTKAKVLLVSSLLWDFEVVEAPWILHREPYYYLFFSSNTFQSPFYHVGVARSLNVTGPYTRNDQNYVIEVDKRRFHIGNVTFVSPGHCSVVQTGDEHWLVYHAWRYGQILQTPPGRMLLIDQIQWTEDQWPVVGYPSDYERTLPNVSDQYSDVYPSITIV